MKAKVLSIFALGALLTGCCCETPQTELPVTTECVVPGSTADFKKNVGDRVFFDFDKSNLGPCAHQTLDGQAKWLKQYNYAVTIVGHCDERGTSAYNFALGERRANAVRRYLIQQGVSADKISIVSAGKERPIVAGSNEEAWRQNRVAITVLESPKDQLSGASVETTTLSTETVAIEDMPQ